MSNKKTLLKENTIRRFMKLASIGPLAENFVEKTAEEELEESTNEELEDLEDLEGEGEEEGEGEDLDAMPAPDELGDEEVETTEVPLTSGVPLAAVEEFVEGLVGLAQEKLGPHGLDIESVPSEEPMDDLEAGPMDDLEAGPMDDLEAGPMDDLEGETEEEEEGLPAPDEEEPPGGRMYEDLDEDTISEIVNRVFSRVNKKNKKESLIDKLAENITSKVFNSAKK